MTTSEPFDSDKYKKTLQLDEEPILRLPSPRIAESNDGEKSAGNLNDLLGQVSNNSKSEIDSLINDLQRLRRKLQTDGDRIQREIEEYHALSQQVMQLTSIISDSVAQLPTIHTSVDRGRTH
jgi:cytochrome c556